MQDLLFSTYDIFYIVESLRNYSRLFKKKFDLYRDERYKNFQHENGTKKWWLDQKYWPTSWSNSFKIFKSYLLTL